jgi:hypothetical protein
MDWLFTRSTVITLAVIGAAASTLAPMLQGRGWLTQRRAEQLNSAGYLFMGASMLCFIVAGFRS